MVRGSVSALRFALPTVSRRCFQTVQGTSKSYSTAVQTRGSASARTPLLLRQGMQGHHAELALNRCRDGQWLAAACPCRDERAAFDVPFMALYRPRAASHSTSRIRTTHARSRAPTITLMNIFIPPRPVHFACATLHVQSPRRTDPLRVWRPPLRHYYAMRFMLGMERLWAPPPRFTNLQQPDRGVPLPAGRRSYRNPNITLLFSIWSGRYRAREPRPSSMLKSALARHC